VLPRLVEPVERAGEIALRTQLLGQFAVEVRQRSATFAIAAAHDLGCDFDRAAPIAFALIDLEQMLQRDAIGRAAAIDQFAQQLFGTIEQARSEVVARQLEFGERAVLRGKMRTFEQVLMDTDGFVELAASAHDGSSVRCASIPASPTGSASMNPSIARSGRSSSR
jgi:hypothetical protein